MEIFYQGTSIKDMVEVSRCIVRDTSTNRCDSVELQFENAAGWAKWGPKEDDTVIVGHNGYTSGIMYVNTVLPEDDKYTIIATSLPCAARKPEYRSFIEKSLGEIIRSCAGYSGLGYQIFGLNKDIVIPYITQNNESIAAFLYRLMMLESATMKIVNGKYTVISNQYAQDSDPTVSLVLADGKDGTTYHRLGTTTRRLTLKTPYADASAIDSAVPEKNPQIEVNSLPVMDNTQAKRWARGKLLWMNRQCERLDLESTFNPSMTAMVKAEIYGGINVSGEWLIEESIHDLVNLRTTSTLRRCIRTIH